MSGVSTLGQALEQIQRIKDQQNLMADLSLQITSGKRTQQFSGLGTEVLTDKRARADFNSLDAYLNNIKNADRRIQQMTAAIETFKKQAEDFHRFLIGFTQESAHQQGDVITYDDPLTPAVEATKVGMTSATPDADFTNIRSYASKIYDLMVDLLNTKDGDRYVFGGAETLTKPITDSGTLDAAISSLITQWKAGGITNAGLISDLSDRTATAGNPDALTDPIVGYSAPLSAGNAGKVFVRVQADAEIDYTALANDSGFRDVLVAMAYIKNDDLPPIADTYTPPNAYPGVPDVQGAPGATMDDMRNNFFQVYNAMVAKVSAAIDQISKVSASLETARSRISELKDSYAQDKNVLLSTVSNIEDADINEVSVKITGLRTQLEASYAVTATLQQYTLVNFLSGNR